MQYKFANLTTSEIVFYICSICEMLHDEIYKSYANM